MRALIGHKAALDASSVGTGKTFVAMAIAKAMEIVPLVVCPRSLRPTWESVADQIGWGVETINYEKARTTKWDEGKGRSVGQWGQEIPHGKGSYWLWNSPVALAIFDEAHLCSGMSTLNSKLLKAAKRQFGYVLALSATAAESPLHLNALGFTLGLHDGRDFWRWLQRYGCKPGWTGGMEFDKGAKGEQAMLKLNSLIFPSRGSRMRKEEIEGFPETQIDIKLLGATVEDLKLAEVAREARETSDLENWQVSMQRLELNAVPQVIELARLYREHSRVAIFANYTATVDAFLQGLDGKIGVVDGRQVGDKGAEDRHRFVTQFQKNELDYICLNAQAGGLGLSLHDPEGKEERTALILPNFSGRQTAQILGRVHRDGGAFSQQFLCAYKGTFQDIAIRTALSKLDKLSYLNDREAFGL